MMAELQSKCTELLGFSIYAGTLHELTVAISDPVGLASERPVTVACLNPHSYVVAKSDSDFFNALKNMSVLLADGIGLTIAYKMIYGSSGVTRITGTDFFEEIMKIADAEGLSVAFLGSSEATLIRISERVRREYAGAKHVGNLSPPFCDEFLPGDVENIQTWVRQTAPDILWVGLTAPKQEKFVYQFLQNSPVRVIGCIGAVFDFYAQTIKRPAPLFRFFGLEWLVRLLREPKRLWRRSMVSGPRFLLDVVKEMVSK